MQCLALARSSRLYSGSSAGQSPSSLRKLTAIVHGLQRANVSSKTDTTAQIQPESATEQAGKVEQLKETASKASDKPTVATSVRLEKFIPITRRSLLKALVQEKGLLSSEEKRLMENVAASLDAKYSKKFYSILEHAKVFIVGVVNQFINVQPGLGVKRGVASHSMVHISILILFDHSRSWGKLLDVRQELLEPPNGDTLEIYQSCMERLFSFQTEFVGFNL